MKTLQTIRLNLKRTNGFRQPIRRFCATVQQKPSRAPPPTTITFQEKAKTASKATLLLGIGVIVIGCGSLIAKELMPTRLSPNSVFSHAFEKIRNDPELIKRVGDKNIKAYGRDMHKNKEGRRNFIDHDKYVDLDGVKHLRIKFVVEGSLGKVNVFAEVNAKQQKDEFNYILIQPMRSSEVVALVDNRKELTREEIQEKVAAKLTKNGAQLYGHSSCQWTQRQLVEFGDFASQLNVTMCDLEENKQKCEKAKLPGYPCWTVQNEQLPGFQPLEQLKEIVTHM